MHFFYYLHKLTVCTKNNEKAGNNVINILTVKGVENTSLESGV